MALGRISGPLLKDNLTRDGVNLRFENDLLYLLVSDANGANHKVGIKNSNPAYPLDVTGTSRSTDIIGTNSATVNNLYLTNNTLSSIIGDLNLTPATGSDKVQVNGSLNITNGLVASGINLLNYNSKVWYVSASTGNDTTGDGHRSQSAFLTVKKALSVAQSGDTVYIEAGSYQEVFPLTVPVGVSVRGAGLRETQISPTVGTNNKDCFLLNGETTVSDLTVKDMFYSVANDTGYAFRFATNITISSRSPYVERVTVLNKGSVTSTSDPYGFTQADAGRGVLIDGSQVSRASLEAAMLFNECTFIVPNSRAVVMTNGARTEWLNCFSYFADLAIEGKVGTAGRAGSGKTYFTFGGVSGSGFQVGETIRFIGTGGTPTVNFVVESISGSKIVVAGSVNGLNGLNLTPGAGGSIRGLTSNTTATSITRYDRSEFAAEMRAIAGASVYGNSGAKADGADVRIHLMSWNFAYIGTGADLSNNRSAVTQVNEAIEVNGGKIYYTSVDQSGNFRVGSLFNVNFDTGAVSFNAPTFDITGLTGINFTDGSNTSIVNPYKVQTGNIVLSGNTISTISGALVIDPTGTEKVTVNASTDINGDLGVTGNVTIGGNIQIGNQTIDTVTVTADFTSNLIPQATLTYDLGSSSLRWNTAYIGTLSASSNATVGGTLGVTGDVAVNTNKFTVNATSGNTAVAGTLDATGNFAVNTNKFTVASSTGNTAVAGTLSAAGSFAINTNKFTVNATSGDTAVAGTLGVTGLSTLATAAVSDLTQNRVVLAGASGRLTDNSNLTFTGSLLTVTADETVTGILNVGNDFKVNTNKFTVQATTGNTYVAGTFGVVGASSFSTISATNGTFSGTLGVTGDTTLGSLSAGATTLSALSVTTTAGIGGSLSVTGNTSVSTISSSGLATLNRLSVTGNTSITGTLTAGATTVSAITASDLTATRILLAGVAGKISDSSKLTFDGSLLTVTADATISGNLNVDGNISIGGNITLGNQAIDTVTVTADFTSDLIPKTTATYDLGSSLYRWNTAYLASANISGATTLTGNVTIGGTLGVTGATTLSTVSTSGLASLNSASITNNTSIGGTLSVTGTTSFGDKIIGNLVPNTVTQDIGSTLNYWRNAYFSGTANIGYLYLQNGTISATNTNGSITLTPDGTGIVTISGTTALKLPIGNDLARPSSPTAGMVRFNSQSNQFEGYASGNWSSLGGVRSVDGKAYIIAETSPAAGDDILHFYSGSSGTSAEVGTWSNTALTVLSPGFRVPVGNTLARPTGVDGYIRYNSEINKFEGFSNGNWSSLGGVSSVNGSTYIGAEAYPGAGDNTLYFVANGITQATIDPTQTLIHNLLNVDNTTNSVSTTTGAIVTAGGIGIAKNLYVGANTDITGTLVSKSNVTFNGVNATISLQPTGTGSVTIAPNSLGSIDNMSVGATTASTGRFTTLTATTSANFSPSGTVTINPTTQSTMDNVSIGSTTRAPGAFTTLTSNGLTTFTNATESTSSSSGAVVVTGGVGVVKNLYVGGNINSVGTITAGSTLIANAGVQLNPDNYNVSIQPTGTGTVTINPAVTGSINNMVIGATTPKAATFTTLTTTGNVTLNSSGSIISLTPTGAGYVTINPGSLGTIDKMTIGGTTAAAGTFTDLTATTSASLSPNGTVVINPTSAGSIDNMSIGATTRSSGAFTTLTSNGATTFTSTTQSTGTSSGAVVISGGVGIAKNLNVGGDFNVTGNEVVTGTFTANNTVTLSPSNASVTISPTGTGSAVINPATVGSIDNMVIGATTARAGTFTTLTGTGALNITDTTQSLSTSTGSIVTAGGVGIAKNVYIGQNLNVTGTATVTSTLTANGAVNLNPANNSISIQPTGTGSVTVYPNSTGSMDNVAIGANNAKSGAFTTLNTTNNVTMAGNNSIVSLTPAGSGYVTINPNSVGTIDNMVIGATTAKAGTFTALTATTSANLSPSGTVTINPTTTSSIDNVNIGATTRGTGAFTTFTTNGATTFTSTTDSSSSSTGAVVVSGGVGIAKKLYVGTNLDVGGTTSLTGTLTANGAVNLNPSNNTVSIAPTGSGTVTINPATTGTIDNMTIGSTTAKGAKFTTVETSGNVTLNGNGSVVSLTPTGSGYVTINPGAAGTINNMSVGQTTPLNGKFTNLVATTSATLDTSGDVSIQPSGTATINPTTTGSINNINIGATTRGTGAFTTLAANSTVTVSDSTQSTSTTTGAVQVAGGVGIVKNLYVGGDTNIAGNLTVLGTTTTVKSTVTTLTDPVITIGGDTDTGLVDPADRGVQIRYAQDISASVTSWTGDGSSSVVANLSVSAASLGFKLGDKINIASSGISGLDGIGTITTVGSNTVTFTAPGNVSSGTTSNVATVGLSKNGFFGYHPSANKFVYIPDAVISSNVVTGNYGDAQFNSLTLVSALGVPQGGTGVTNFTTKGIIYGNGTSALQVTAASDMGGANATASYGILTTDSNNTPVWTDVIDCGTY